MYEKSQFYAEIKQIQQLPQTSEAALITVGAQLQQIPQIFETTLKTVGRRPLNLLYMYKL